MAKATRRREQESGVSGPGNALRDLRGRNGWTLVEVSQITGVPVSTLSRIENGLVSPTYDILVRLSRGLEIDLADLLSGNLPQRQPQRAQPGRRSINRAGQGETIDLHNHTLRYQSTDLLGKLITPIVSEYRARSLAEFGDFMHHPGEEYLYVIEGELEFHTESYTPVILAAGDSIYFDSRMGHAYVARTVPCRALSICAAGESDEGTGAGNSAAVAGAVPPVMAVNRRS